MRNKDKETRAKLLKERLELYYAREKEMLSGGYQSYGLGTRNAAKYQTDLNAIRDAIKEMEQELRELNSKYPRKAVGVVPRDW
jgi:hypothetical protein